jgi:hypothetical protein
MVTRRICFIHLGRRQSQVSLGVLGLLLGSSYDEHFDKY